MVRGRHAGRTPQACPDADRSLSRRQRCRCLLKGRKTVPAQGKRANIKSFSYSVSAGKAEGEESAQFYSLQSAAELPTEASFRSGVSPSSALTGLRRRQGRCETPGAGCPSALTGLRRCQGRCGTPGAGCPSALTGLRHYEVQFEPRRCMASITSQCCVLSAWASSAASGEVQARRPQGAELFSKSSRIFSRAFHSYCCFYSCFERSFAPISGIVF